MKDATSSPNNRFERGAVDALFITSAAPAQFGREVDRLVDAGRIAGNRLRMAQELILDEVDGSEAGGHRGTPAGPS